jgi:hypothetical protein
MPVHLDVDPGTLHLPPSRLGGADPGKLTRELSLYGFSVVGMPRLFVIRDGQGRLQIIDGVTRATRVAKWIPGQIVPVEVIHDYPNDDFSSLPLVRDRLP